jgi:hypothetical protein
MLIASVMALLLAAPVSGQSIGGGGLIPGPPGPPGASPDVTALNTKIDQAAADAAAAIAKAAAAQAAIPQRATSLPPTEVTAPVLGSSMQYRGADDPQPRITRTASCTVTISNGIGSCEVAWDGSPFAAGVTPRLAGAPATVTATVGPVNEQPMTCKAYGMTRLQIGFRCWQAQSSVLTAAVLTAGATVLPFAPPATVTVQATALPSS